MEGKEAGAAVGAKDSFQERMKEILERANRLQPEEMTFRYQGLLYPTVLTSAETLQELLTFQARPEDMMVSSYPKCGFNWVNQLLWDIASTNQSGSKDWKLGGLFKVKLLEFEGAERYEMMKNEPSPRVYGTHNHYDNLPPSVLEKKTKVLVVLRNPKDNAVSYYHFYQNNPLLPNVVSWDDFFRKYMTGEVCWGSYFDHALTWEKHIDDENVMLITYEELKENLPKGIQMVAEFFGLSMTEEQIQKVAGRGTFQAMSDNSQATHSTFGKVIFRKGVVGDWRSLFTEEQSQEMDAKFEACLAGTKVGAKLKYNLYC
ncbi:sulfotransferase 6B1 isoform X1 [Scyliorhinus canicula]|uniref:sulfotransferase 6B1 isoform X1 n=1 Tax=Scyliorhinus canicula TaxID=7830 RepID=UPI0018F406B1|nr:sulfotransferase 6B1 isoform X1 [Scyliorhinus canicula]